MSIELRRLAAGLLAVEASGTKVEYARLLAVPGASRLTGMRLPNLAAIAVAVAGPRWPQVRAADSEWRMSPGSRGKVSMPLKPSDQSLKP